MLTKSIVLFFSLFFINAQSQLKIDSVKFGSPLTIPLILAGNFGELRSNHFHTGLDIKTGGIVGKKIVSIEKGFVSRIAISHTGYGTVLYIDHPNGYTSVYAHLLSFSDKIEEKVKQIQIANESETFDVTLDSNQLKITKGEFLALSGNSGSSFAPHLHFEIRETQSEHPVNPLLFGFDIADNTKPDIKGVKFYPIGNNATINGAHEEVYVPTLLVSNGNYKLSKPVLAYGEIGLGTHATDRLDGAGNVCGIFNLDLYCNDTKIFNHNLTYMDFGLSRYINQHKDYNEFHRRRRNIHKNFSKGNNKLPIYGTTVNNGIINVLSDSVYNIAYNISDVHGNESKLNFEITRDSTSNKIYKENLTKCIRYFSYNIANYLDTTNFNVLMAENTLYDNQCVTYSAKKGYGLLSDIHSFGDENIPVQHYFKIQIKPDTLYDSLINTKLVIVAVNSKGQKSNKKGEFINGFVSTRVRDFGSYAVALDTVRPYILLKTNAKSLLALNKKSKIQFSISDNLSGIETYKVFIDNKWELSNYNRRNGRLVMDLANTSIQSGNHQVVVVVTDERGNVNKSEMEIKVF